MITQSAPGKKKEMQKQVRLDKNLQKKYHLYIRNLKHAHLTHVF